MEAPAAPPAPVGLPAVSRRVAVLLAGAGIAGIILWLGRDVLAPFVVGLLIVYLLDPLVERLARVRIRGRGVPRALLILLVYVVATLLVVEFIILVSGPLIEQIRAFAQAAPGYIEDLNRRLAELFSWWNRLDLPADVKEAVDKALADFLASIGSLAPSILRPVFSSVVGLVGSVFGYLVIPVWAFWILKDRPAIVRAFDRAVPAGWRADTWATLGIVRRVFGSWVRGQIVLGLIVGVFTFVGLLVLGATVDPVFSRFAVLLAVIAGFLELLPVIGPIISAIPAVVLGATAGIPGVVAALALYFAVQQVENNFLVPKVQGDATNLHPAVVLFALILGGAIAGLLGAILALPVAATGRDLYVYAFRRAGGLAPEQAATGDARSAADTGPQGVETDDEGPADTGAGDAGPADTPAHDARARDARSGDARSGDPRAADARSTASAPPGPEPEP